MSAVDLSTPVPDYEPEPWDVVKTDPSGTDTIIVRAVGIAVADEKCAWLNKRVHGGYSYWYEVRAAS